MPIPSEVIFGQSCGVEIGSIVTAADALAALNYMQSLQSKSIPSNMVGLANPSVATDGFKITLNLGSSLRSSLIGEDLRIDEFPPLPGAVEEVAQISDIFLKKALFMNESASINSAVKSAEEAVLSGARTALILATHGMATGEKDDLPMPSLLTLEDGSFDLYTANMVATRNLNGSVIVLSACDTASGFVSDPDRYFTGFVSAFSDAGAELIMATLWPVKSSVSKKTTTKFFSEWKKNDLRGAIHRSKARASNDNDYLPFVFIAP